MLLTAAHASQYASQGIATLSVDEEQSEIRPRLVEGLLYSSEFIKTYQIALCVVVLAFTISHWYGKLVSTRQTSKDGGYPNRNDDVLRSRASSGTLEGNTTPLELGKGDERSLLLSKRPEYAKTSQAQRGWRRLRAMGMYQPRPIPVVNKTLPSNLTTMLVLSLLSLNLFYAFYNIEWELPLAFIWSDRSALLLVSNLPWLYIVAANNQPLEFLTGYSYEQLNILHRRLGELVCLLAVLHGTGMLLAWYCFFQPTGQTIWQFFCHPLVWHGLVAFFCYEILYFTSLASFRQRWYELFLGSHIMLQLGGLVFLYLHHRNAKPCVLISVAIIVLDRWMLRKSVKSRFVQVDLKIMEDGDTMLLSADWPLNPCRATGWNSIFAFGVKNGWKPTKHVFISMPTLGAGHNFQFHPFTIASAAPESDQEHAWFSLIIRAHDGFTRQLLNYAHNHASANVRVDGPL